MIDRCEYVHNVERKEGFSLRNGSLSDEVAVLLIGVETCLEPHFGLRLQKVVLHSEGVLRTREETIRTEVWRGECRYAVLLDTVAIEASEE